MTDAEIDAAIAVHEAAADALRRLKRMPCHADRVASGCENAAHRDA
jgi:hypothetical protein